jgi:hypothetical protein
MHNSSDCLTSDAGFKFFGQMIQAVNAANRIFKYRLKYIAAERIVPNTLLAHCEGKRRVRSSTIEEVKNTALPQDTRNLWVKKTQYFFLNQFGNPGLRNV